MNDYPIRQVDQLYDDIWLPDETIAVRAKVREFTDNVLRPMAHALNNTPKSVEKFPWSVGQADGRCGLVPHPLCQRGQWRRP